ncbi:hypothetical protein AC1031_009865 [Aphanomyces cochlioides]|nr:hypothetical protein AC1031_009865 [Aphanomyces cochlioides]
MLVTEITASTITTAVSTILATLAFAILVFSVVSKLRAIRSTNLCTTTAVVSCPNHHAAFFRARQLSTHFQHPPLPVETPADVASALLDTTPPIVQYSVVAVVLIQGLDSSGLSEAEYDFASAVASSLEHANASVGMDNVSLSYRDVNINSTNVLEVTVGVVVDSAVAMNATDLRFQDMMFGNVTYNTLGKDLVAKMSCSTRRNSALTRSSPMCMSSTTTQLTQTTLMRLSLPHFELHT